METVAVSPHSEVNHLKLPLDNASAYQCGHCMLECGAKKSLKLHMNEYHPGEEFHCLIKNNNIKEEFPSVNHVVKSEPKAIENVTNPKQEIGVVMKRNKTQR